MSGWEGTLKKFLRQIYDVYRPLRFAVLGILGFIAISQVLNLVTPYLQSKVIDGLVKKQPAEHIYLFVAGALALWIFRVTAFRIWRERYVQVNR